MAEDRIQEIGCQCRCCCRCVALGAPTGGRIGAQLRLSLSDPSRSPSEASAREDGHVCIPALGGAIRIRWAHVGERVAREDAVEGLGQPKGEEDAEQICHRTRKAIQDVPALSSPPSGAPFRIPECVYKSPSPSRPSSRLSAHSNRFPVFLRTNTSPSHPFTIATISSSMPAVVSNATRIWELNIHWALFSQCGVWDPKGRGVDIWECIRARESPSSSFLPSPVLCLFVPSQMIRRLAPRSVSLVCPPRPRYLYQLS